MDNKKLLKAAGIIAGIGVIIWLLTRKSGKSNFTGATTMGTRFFFMLNNDTDQPVTYNLFNAYGLSSIVAGGKNAEYFTKSLLNEPKKVNAFEMHASGANVTAQMDAPVTVVCKDASGTKKVDDYYPQVSAYQAQPNIVSVSPQDLVLDGSCTVKYVVKPHTRVGFTVYYDKFDKSKLMKK